MKQNDQQLYEATSWILYHGTSTARLNRILEDGRLRRSPFGDQKIALTTERSVAEYFACNAVSGEKYDNPGEESSPVVLVLDGEGLLELNYNLVSFSDPILGRRGVRLGKRDSVLGPLDEVLMAVEPVPSARYQVFIERGDMPFKPATPPLATIELTVMPEVIGKLVGSEITPEDADGVVSALGRIRSALRSNADGGMPSPE